MARKTTTKAQIVRVPMSKPPAGMKLVPRGAIGAVGGKLRRAGKHIRRHGRIGSFSVGKPLAGAALGAVAKRFAGDYIPDLPYVGKDGTIGGGLYLAGVLFKSPLLKQMSVGPLCVAIDKAIEGGISGSASGYNVDGYTFG